MKQAVARAPFRSIVRNSTLALASTLVFGLSGCLVGEDEGDTEGSGFSFNTQGEILTLTAPQGGQPGTIVTRVSDYTCWDEEDDLLPAPVLSTETDTASYVITGGKLYVWERDECWAEQYTGSSATIQGTWTSTTFNVAKIPEGHRSQQCIEEYEECEEGDWCEDDYDDDVAFANLSATVAITSTAVQSTVSGEFCLARMMASAYDSTIFGTAGYEVISSGCASAQVRNVSANKIATFSSSSNGTIHTLTFKYGGTTCTSSQHFGPIDANTQCSETEGVNPEGEMTACMAGSGFFDGEEEEEFSLAKQSQERFQSALEILKGGNSPFKR